MIKEMLKVLESVLENQLRQNPIYQHVNALQEGVKAKQYQPLMSRIKCGTILQTKFDQDICLNEFLIWFFTISIAESLENRIEHYAKKRRIELKPVSEVASKRCHIDDECNE